ncbi:MAG TPA: DUF1501 domain-containing protein [Polyangia bacterium]|nr:DUF1501 domain-containing protein [Polyangia bacterium]
MTISRRDLLQWGAGSGLGAFATSIFARRAEAAATASPAKACILLYMAGGPSHIDTFDPKPGRPTGGEFKAIGTAVDGIQLCEHLPRLGNRMKKLALIRSLTSKEGNHDRARHLMHTGYPPQGGVDHPAFGSLVSETREHGGMPGYVAIGGPGEDSGFLSAIHSPFPVRNPTKPVRYLTPAKNVDAERFERRLALWRGVEDRFSAGRGGAFAKSQRAIGEQAVALMRSTGAAAFDLSAEPAKTSESYGPSEFGQGCLMARRLVEAGVPFVEVTLGGWDTHDDNFARVKALCQTLDQGMSALLDDLSGRGLLDSTLVLWMGDFGRTPRINEKGGRDHFPACSSVLLAGGGIRGGQVIGSTDQNGAEVRDRPITVPDLYRTVAQVLDVNADKQRVAPSGRPIKTVNGGKLIEGLT